MKKTVAMLFNYFAITMLFMSTSNADGVLDSLQSINQSHYHQLNPEALGRPLHIVVKLPVSYQDGDAKKYPAVYLLDGGAVFPMVGGYYNYLINEEVIPEAIIVGISYGSDRFEGGNYRSTDYTAPTDQREYWGGAAGFRGVVEQELLPLIESTYRADPDKRILFGQSLGGQFVLYTALTSPRLFWGYIASNPALHRNLEFFLQRHSTETDTGSRLFVASASNDDPRFRGPAVKWIDYWAKQANLPWTLNALSVPGYGHFSLVTESFRLGLMWIFQETDSY